MPAPTSSRILTAAQELDAPAALAPAQCRDLLGHLAQITDPRQRRGRRHALSAVLAVAVAAVLAGARSLVAIGEWAADVRRDPLRRLWRPPGEATVRPVLARVDPGALDLVIGRWLADQQRPPPQPAWRRAVAVDGKTLRGSGHHGSSQVHLLATMDHPTRAVLAQADADDTTNEIAGFQPLLDRWTSPPPWSPPMRSTPSASMPSGWSRSSRPPRAAREGQPASLRNLAIGILHARGDRNIAAALRRNARDATRVLPLLGITSP